MTNIDREKLVRVLSESFASVLSSEELAELLVEEEENLQTSAWSNGSWEIVMERPWEKNEDPDEQWLRVRYKNVPRRVRVEVCHALNCILSAASSAFGAGRKTERGDSETEKEADNDDC